MSNSEYQYKSSELLKDKENKIIKITKKIDKEIALLNEKEQELEKKTVELEARAKVLSGVLNDKILFEMCKDVEKTLGQLETDSGVYFAPKDPKRSIDDIKKEVRACYTSLNNAIIERDKGLIECEKQKRDLLITKEEEIEKINKNYEFDLENLKVECDVN